MNVQDNHSLQHHTWARSRGMVGIRRMTTGSGDGGETHHLPLKEHPEPKLILHFSACMKEQLSGVKNFLEVLAFPIQERWQLKLCIEARYVGNARKTLKRIIIGRNSQ